MGRHSDEYVSGLLATFGVSLGVAVFVAIVDHFFTEERMNIVRSFVQSAYCGIDPTNQDLAAFCPRDEVDGYAMVAGETGCIVIRLTAEAEDRVRKLRRAVYRRRDFFRFVRLKTLKVEFTHFRNGLPSQELPTVITKAANYSEIQVSFSTTVSGIYMAQIYYDGNVIRNSPMNLRVTAATVNPQKCELRLPPLLYFAGPHKLNKQGVIIVRDIYGNLKDKYGPRESFVCQVRPGYGVGFGDLAGTVMRSRAPFSADNSDPVVKEDPTGVEWFADTHKLSDGNGELAIDLPVSYLGEYIVSAIVQSRPEDSIPGSFRRIHVVEESSHGTILKMIKSGRARFKGRMQVPESRVPTGADRERAGSEPLDDVVRGFAEMVKGVRNLFASIGNSPSAVNAQSTSHNAAQHSSSEGEVSQGPPVLDVVLVVNKFILAVKYEVPGWFSTQSTLMYTSRLTPDLAVKWARDSREITLISPDTPYPLTIEVTSMTPQVFAATVHGLMNSREPSLSFEERVLRFRRQAGKLKSQGVFVVQADRHNVLMDSFHQLHNKNRNRWLSRFKIRFRGEEGIDDGGVSREWFLLVSRQLFDVNVGLFAINDQSDLYVISPTSTMIPDYLQLFRFAGMFVAKALVEGILLDCHLARSLCKQILGQPLSMFDLETDDPELYKSAVRYLLENDITDVDLGMTFVVEENIFGKVASYELKKGGSEIAVMEKNKMEYARLLTEYKMQRRTAEQLDQFLKGFHFILPKNILGEYFNDSEIEMLLNGLPSVDLEDLKKHTEYRGCRADSRLVAWFWDVAEGLNQEQKCKLLQFSTGTSKVPLGGFQSLNPRFTVVATASSGTRLPTSHTCFHQIVLPNFQSKETLRAHLLLAITEGSEGFGIA